LVSKKEARRYAKNNAIVGFQSHWLIARQLLTVDENVGHCCVTQRPEDSFIFIGFKNCVFVLDTDTTKDQLGVLGLIHLFSANCALSNFAQINKDLAV
jgi:hypothetical protein